MKNHSTRYARPALWGFFICVTITGILVVLRIFIPSYINYRWDSERTAWRIHTEQVIRDAFQGHVEQLTRLAEHAATDTSLVTGINLNGISDVRKTYQILDSYRIRDDQTLDLVDLQGNVLAWKGPSITPLYADVLGNIPTEKFIRVTQNRLRTYLTVGVHITQSNLFVMVSEPLEVNSPISNRFVQNVSLSNDLSQKLKVKVALRLPQTYALQYGEVIVPIVDKEGKTIAEFSVAEISLESAIVSTLEDFTMLITLCLVFASLFLGYSGILWIAGKQRVWITIISAISFLWLVRFVWHEMGFPADLIGGWLFSPNLYASPFAFSLSSSLGELVISTVTVAISAWLFFIGIVLNKRMEETISRIGLRIGKIGAITFVFAITFILLWFFRGFGEALRSFVFDSTIQYNNPSEMLLEGTAALMHFNILLLGVSLLCLSTALLWMGRKLFSVQFHLSELAIRIILIVFILACIPMFALLDKNPQVPLSSSILLLLLSSIFVELLMRWNNADVSVPSQKWQVMVWMLLGSFLIGTPIMHQKLRQKERKEVEVVANEFLRTSDSWLSYVVIDGLHASVDDLANTFKENRLITAKETNLAFVLWTKTLFGKEGYNSALVLYNRQGEEVDRFVVGMSKPEQREILTRVFEGEEDAVHVLGRTGPTTLGKMYGAWATIRDSTGQGGGSIALLLSENQKTIFHEDGIEPLRQFGYKLEKDVVREMAVHEYQADTLVFSTGRRLYPDRFLSSALKNELQRAPNAVLWKDTIINGYETQTVLMRDPSSPEIIISISLEELDVRWDLFSYLKEFFIYLTVLAVVGVYVLVRRSGGRFLQAIGYRGKLFLGFACITLLPLAVLSYYNRQLVADRVQEGVETTLYRQLTQLQDRISTYVSDEEDFIYGVDDDFCEALADEYGIDFSIYRQASIQASSRSELYRAALLDGRLNGEAFALTVLDGKSFVLAKEKIGSVEYAVGYAPISIVGNIVGVLAIPTLNRQKEIESELAQRNAYVFGAYALVFGIALAGGGLLALRFTRPLRQLTLAAKDVSEGNLDVSVSVHSHDEIGTLTRSFNEMISKLRTSRIELAKHERESAWKEMAKQVAHEIRNPLTPIKLSIQHLSQAFKDKAPDREEILQRVAQTVIEQIEALSRIASEFSNFAKMPERIFERLDIHILLQETITLFREVQGVTFINRLAPLSIMVVADRDQLRGVFINIVRNAIQAINKTGTITIETVLEGRVCIIRISDTGQGIPEEIRAKIFEPNFSTKTEGMGLGLAIARRVIEDHGGTISCSSEGAKGTMFEIRLPV